MPKLHGIPVQLTQRVEVGKDDLNIPVYEDVVVTVDNVLVGTPSSTDIIDSQNLIGKQAAFILGIPKGDTHQWEDAKVSFWGRDFQVIGVPMEGIDDLVPLQWNKRVIVREYEV